jgi:putative ATP-binding cassette transporter
MWLAILTGMLSGVSSAGLIALISRSINQAHSDQRLWILTGFCGLVVVALITSIFSQILLVRVSQDAVLKMRLQLIRQILQTDLPQLEEIGIPRLMAVLTQDVNSITIAIERIPFVCIDLATAVGCIIYITWLSWSGFALTIVLCSLAGLTCIRFLRKGEAFLKLARDQEDQLFSHFQSTTEGIKELKLNYPRKIDFLDSEVEATARSFRNLSVQGLNQFAISSSFGKLIFFLAAGIILFALPMLIGSNQQLVSSYILTFTFMMLPIDNIVNNLPYLSKSSVALRKINSLRLSKIYQSSPILKPIPCSTDWQRLELKNVAYPYRRGDEDEEFVLGPINLHIKRGESVFIVGGNGSGKSTLAKLLTGLYSPKTGEIRLDDYPIDNMNREWYRQHFSAIFADFHLFGKLIGFDDQDLDSKADYFLNKLKLNGKVKVDNGRFSTLNLSQGQRKRLALVTSYLEDRHIYLFDEWAADQDPIFKQIFYSEILPDLRNSGKTVIVISHDDRYFYLADRIVKLEDGKIVNDYLNSNPHSPTGNC